MRQRLYVVLKGHRTIVATPDGLPRGPGGLDGFDRTFDVDEPSADFTFVEDLVSYLDSILCVSPTERFSAGMSRGGQLSSRLVCLPELRLKAFAGVTALKGPCANGTRVPVLAFQGTSDILYAEMERNTQLWAEHNGCRRTPRESRIEPDIVVRHYLGCSRGDPVTFYVVEGGGHSWPGASLDVCAHSAFPDSCLLKESMATVPGEDSAAVKKEFVEFIRQKVADDPWMKDHPPEVVFTGYFAEPSAIPADSPIVRALCRKFTEVTGKEPMISGREGAADIRFTNRYGDTPTVIFGPGMTEQMHANNEWANMDDLVQATKILSQTILEWCRVA